MSGKYDGASICVSKWEIYNPRSDVKRPSWFRLENEIALGSEFFGLDSDTRWLWIVILAQTSKQNGRAFEWKSEFVKANTGISISKQDQALKTFEETGRITVTRNVHVTSTYAGSDETFETRPLRDGTGRDERDGTNPTNGTERDGKSDSGLPALVEIWNKRKHPTLPAVERMNPSGKRYRACVTRWEANPEAGYWEAVIDRINRSPFCLGANERGWKADIEFLCRPDSAEKVLEGKYDRSGSVPIPAAIKPKLDPETEAMEAECEAILRGLRG